MTNVPTVILSGSSGFNRREKDVPCPPIPNRRTYIRSSKYEVGSFLAAGVDPLLNLHSLPAFLLQSEGLDLTGEGLRGPFTYCNFYG